MNSLFEESSIRHRFRVSTPIKVAAIVVITVILGSAFLFSRPFDNGSFDGTLTHQLDIWTEPQDYEFDINMQFYLTLGEAENSVGRLVGTQLTIAPDSDGDYTIYLYNIPLTSGSVWVVLFCRYESGVETDAVIEELTLSVSKVILVDAPEITLRLSAL